MFQVNQVLSSSVFRRSGFGFAQKNADKKSTKEESEFAEDFSDFDFPEK
jgi:hypothetical protein